jgi:hypothetical protein
MYYPEATLGQFRDSPTDLILPGADSSPPTPLRRSTNDDACCSNNDECGAGEVCTASLNAYLQLGSHEAACVADHCTNRVLDTALGEERVDCGGADCAPCTCSTTPVWGAVGHCTAACPCGIGGVDCHTNADCLPGLLCVQESAWRYGGPEGTEACVPQHCNDRMLNGDETGPLPDWGGSCGSNRCFASPNGGYAHCTVSCPCPAAEGDCDYNDECQSGLVCTTKGPNFGVAFNVCLLPHCTDRKKNFDETGIDCGGADCGPICP